MENIYRKFFNPEYGEPSSETMIDEPQEIDLRDPATWRNKSNLETVAALTTLIKPCYCYKPIMTIKTTNTIIDKKDHSIPIRIYHPTGTGPYSVMIFYHGGGWSMNNLDVYDYIPRYLAYYGNILVIAPDYRLAPEHPFPEGLEDAYDTVLWAAEYAGKYGGNAAHLTVCGDSAGGNFAAVVSLMARDRNGPVIHHQILIYPATVLKTKSRPESEKHYGDGGYFLTLNSEKGICNFYFKNPIDAENPYASPLLAKDLSKLPPACFISAECDPLLDQALMYAAKLQDTGIQVEYYLKKGMVHGFINRPYQKTFEALHDIITFEKI